MKTTFWGPSVYPDKPRFDRYNLSTIETNAVTYTATSSYSPSGYKVPLLAYRGSEPLLPQYVNPAQPSCTPVCYGLFDGTYRSSQFNFTWIQNIHKNLFVELSSSVVYDTIKDITITPATKNGCALSQSYLDQHPGIQNYLDILNRVLFSNPNNNFQKIRYVGPTYILGGYTKTWNDLQKLDFIDFSIETGCIIPVVILEREMHTVSVFPKQHRVNLGIPLLATCCLGLYDWLNIGFSGSVTGYIKNDVVIPLNATISDNKIIMPCRALCTVHHKPSISLSAYIEGEYLLPSWTWLVGLSYYKQYKTCYSSHDQCAFPNDIINQHPTYHPWEIAYVTLSTEFDLGKHNSHALPRCKLLYAKPLRGKACFNSRGILGQLGVEIIYDF